MDAKPWWASKTVWANLFGGIVLLGAAVGYPTCTPDLSPETICLPLDEEQQTKLIAGIMVVTNLILRALTWKRVTLKKEN